MIPYDSDFIVEFTIVSHWASPLVFIINYPNPIVTVPNSTSYYDVFIF